MSAALDAAARRGRWGNAAMLAAVVALGLALLPLHDDAWWTAMPRPAQWRWAAVVLVAYIAACGWLLLRTRDTQAQAFPLRDGGPEAAWLVAFASQTGFARELAEQTAAALASAGTRIDVLPLQHVSPARLARVRHALFVVSTTGEGDPPDHALAFVRDAMDGGIALPGLRYAVLALGDRAYGRFCGFGHRLDAWLRHAGATPLFDLVEVDNGDPGALRHWQHHLAQQSGADALPDWTPPRYERWTLQQRLLLNPGSAGAPAFHLALHSEDALPRWRAGDIAEIGPCQPAAAVGALLARHGLAGDAPVTFRAQRMPLREALARCRLPLEDAHRGLAPQALVDALPPLPHREYSIASLPTEGALQLLVRRMASADGTPGLGSGWLCDHAAVGDAIDLRIRANPNFRAPDDDRPLLLIGNGTGIAGLRGLLCERIAAGRHRNWLLFGERHRDRDHFYRDAIAGWQAAGAIERVDLAFSRDGDGPRYVQDALRAQADRLRDWVANGAAIFVCGSLQGMAPGVDAVLRETLGDAAVDDLRDGGRYRRDVY